ncbi:MAG: hypothetical protein OEZ59_13830, partial [Deltaproteobacteria bacterium]|nr:hypothetical protein [Deltaproteobacteria bacterium]
LTGFFWLGGVIHIFGDLFTPGMQMPVFWPLEHRFGGWSHIGWVSPYLLWLFLATFLLDAGIRLGAKAGSRLGGRFSLLIRPQAVQAFIWSVYFLSAYRWVDFLVESRFDSRSQWLAFHQTLLPEAMITSVRSGIGYMWRLLVY